MKLDLLAIGAHPDDVELSCSGTLYKAALAGKKTGIIDLTLGELGTRGSAEIRRKEAAAAAKILKVSIRENTYMDDGFFEITEENLRALIIKIRKYQPEIVLCNALEDRHPDHARAAALVSRACFLSGLRKIETHYQGENQNAHRPKAIYHYIQWKSLKPDFVVDISEAIEAKIDAVKAYESQFFNPDSNEPETPLTSVNFLNSIRYRAADLGRLTGVEYAEGFNVERIPLVNSIFDLK